MRFIDLGVALLKYPIFRRTPFIFWVKKAPKPFFDESVCNSKDSSGSSRSGIPRTGELIKADFSSAKASSQFESHTNFVFFCNRLYNGLLTLAKFLIYFLLKLKTPSRDCSCLTVLGGSNFKIGSIRFSSILIPSLLITYPTNLTSERINFVFSGLSFRPASPSLLKM